MSHGNIFILEGMGNRMTYWINILEGMGIRMTYWIHILEGLRKRMTYWINGNWNGNGNSNDLLDKYEYLDRFLCAKGIYLFIYIVNFSIPYHILTFM